LHQQDTDAEGFYMIDCQDNENSVMAFMRRGHFEADDVVVICNFTPTTQYNYRVGVPYAGQYIELLNTDNEIYGGSGQLNAGDVWTQDIGFHGHAQSLSLTLPPLGVTFLKRA
jgi:1,4-alpha-glucan branching enzyme